MAIVSVKELTSDRGSSERLGEVTYHRLFQVVTDAVTDTGFIVRTANDGTMAIPAWGKTHPEDERTWVSEIAVSQQEGNEPLIWRVDVSYTSKVDVLETIPEDPLAEPATVTWGFVTTQEGATHDAITVEPIHNSFGQPYDPALVRDVTRPVCTVSRLEPTYSVDVATFYYDTVNNDVFRIVSRSGFTQVGVGLAKCAGISGTEENFNGRDYWRVVYEFHFRRPIAFEGQTISGWNQIIRDIGFEGKFKVGEGDNQTTKIGQFVNNEGVQYQQAQDLNGRGERRADFPNDPDEPHYDKWSLYEERAFAELLNG